jgi:hypothetical protein
MDEHDELPESLRTALDRAGRQPVPAPIAEAHLRRMAGEPTRQRRRTMAKVVAGFSAGFLLGGSGLAVAGALPDPAQDVAARAFATVGIEVPRSTDGCPDGREYESHGAYVSEVAEAGGDVPAAARSNCGMPVTAVEARGRGEGAGPPDGAGRPDGAGPPEGMPHADDPCRGRPPWAGRTDLSETEREAMAAEREANCPDEPEGDGPPIERPTPPERPEQAEPPAPAPERPEPTTPPERPEPPAPAPEPPAPEPEPPAADAPDDADNGEGADDDEGDDED